MEEILKILFGFLYQLTDKAKQIYLALDPCFVVSSITDSFTVIVGFVAIGIPLSLQVISRATEKYKSDHLVIYLSSWKLVTPKRIYWASIFYFILALIFKALLSTNDVNCNSLIIKHYAWILIFIFLSLLIFVGFWYGHLFSQAGKRPKEIYDALKK